MVITRIEEKLGEREGGKREMAKSERLLFMIDLLKKRGRVSRREVAEMCGISERTLYRDLRTLAKLKMPVASDGTHVIKSEAVSIENFSEITDGELEGYGRILDTFVTAIKWGVPVIVTTMGGDRSNQRRYLPAGIKFKRSGLCLVVRSASRKKVADIPIVEIMKISVAISGSRTRSKG